MVEPITVHLNLQPMPPVASSTNADPSVLAISSTEVLTQQSGVDHVSSAVASESVSEEWVNGNFNYAEMSRIGDKTPEIDEAFLQYSSYFP
jgi:hypothetical protein